MSAPAATAQGPALGVVVPCRNEAAVVARKVANLALLEWPPPGARPHRIVLVDDGSEDGTADAARAALAACAAQLAAARVEARVVPNAERPGKPGAVRAGLRELGALVDVVVLTDADVVLAPAALAALARAFAARAELALASGAQRFVADLAADGSASGAGGSARGADGADPIDASSAFDRWTARVRALESRFGRLFSVHGQLLAWRAELGLAPTPGIAADDLDLMLQVRARAACPRRVELVREAQFLEVKARGAEAAGQELRRARAYVQVVRAWDGRARGLQWRFYRHMPLAAPALTLAGAALAPAVLAAVGGVWSAAAGAALLLSCALTPAGRGWLRLMRRIHEASRLQRAEPLAERWEMARR